jgi:EAL domain-containing protein (putative c-di-GMP-specific phosphodiesterase class I)
LGASLVIDDFGMGYSSFSQLRNLAFDRLKIDRSFVQGMRGELDGRIVDAMIGLASGLGIDVVAEGVEEEWMARMLIEKGCRFAQGFHFARPMPADRLARLLAGGRTLPAPAD